MEKPSILFITTDEQHRSTVMEKERPFSLPGLDGLLGCSDIYENAYSASPVCLPARCSLMTGMYPHCSGSVSNIFGASLSRQFPNLFTCLKSAGYTTSMHGKCHFIPVPYPATRADVTLEYEHFSDYYRSLGMDHLDLQDDKNNSLWYYDDFSKELEQKDLLTAYRKAYHGAKPPFVIEDFPLKKENHPDSWVGRKALEYLDCCRADSPHFMWVSFSGPHYPMDAPNDYLNTVDMTRDLPRYVKDGEWEDKTKLHRNSYYGPGGTEGSGNAPGGAQKEFNDAYWEMWRRRYYANIVQIDGYIDKIIKKARKIWGDNLTVIFTCDHGDMMGNHGLWGKNHSLHEDVIRIPLLVSRHGQKNARRITQTVSSLEIFPTVLSAAGAKIPERCDGMPLNKMTKSGGREYIISECDNRVAVISGGIKLCLNVYERTGELYRELYDLNSDPHEFINLYNDPAYEKHREKLYRILERHEQSEGLLSTVFYTNDKKPYWFNGENGAGLRQNRFIK